LVGTQTTASDIAQANTNKDVAAATGKSIDAMMRDKHGARVQQHMTGEEMEAFLNFNGMSEGMEPGLYQQLITEGGVASFAIGEDGQPVNITASTGDSARADNSNSRYENTDVNTGTQYNTGYRAFGGKHIDNSYKNDKSTSKDDGIYVSGGYHENTGTSINRGYSYNDGMNYATGFKASVGSSSDSRAAALINHDGAINRGESLIESGLQAGDHAQVMAGMQIVMDQLAQEQGMDLKSFVTEQGSFVREVAAGGQGSIGTDKRKPASVGFNIGGNLKGGDLRHEQGRVQGDGGQAFMSDRANAMLQEYKTLVAEGG